MTVDVPEEYLGVVTQLLALRKGLMEQIINHGTGGCGSSSWFRPGDWSGSGPSC